MPLAVVFLSPPQALVYAEIVSTLVFLAVLGALGARAGGAGLLKPAIRVTFWGAVAMGITALVGRMFGAVL